MHNGYKQNPSVSLIVAEGAWSFLSAEGAGWRNITFQFGGIDSSLVDCQVKEDSDAINMILTRATVRENIEFKVDVNSSSLRIRRSIANTSGQPVALRDITDGKNSAAAAVIYPDMSPYSVCYLHGSNQRKEAYPRSRPEYPFIRQVPYQARSFGVDDANTFPAWILFDEGYNWLLLEGDLNQKMFVREWTLGLDGKNNNELVGTYLGQLRAPMTDGIHIAPGDTVEVSNVFYQILVSTHPQDAFSGYLRALDDLHKFAGPLSPMRHGSIYCTWNYGIMDEIEEGMLSCRAALIAARLKCCTHFLIDDGFQKDRNKRPAGIDSFYPIPSESFDKRKFPSGMRAMADVISKQGLVPCIWLSPRIYLDSKLAKDHPDWLLLDESGSPELIGQTTFLDLSSSSAREFYLSVLDCILLDWGYRGIKFDFMTQWFSLESGRYRDGRTGVQWRDYVFGEIRKRIGPNGLLMTCIAMSMGNPFLGLYADSYRCGCDIHSGSWREQVKACKATLPQLLIEGRRTSLLNMDSAGFGEATWDEQIFRLTWIFITQGIIEIGGEIEKMDATQISLLNKLCFNADRGHKVRCLDERAFTGEGLPQILQVEYPPQSLLARRGIRSHIAFFNWQEDVQSIGASNSRLDIKDTDSLFNYWTAEALLVSQLSSNLLAPHSALLVEVRMANQAKSSCTAHE